MHVIFICGFLILPALANAARPALTETKVSEIRGELNKLITNSSNGVSMVFIPGFVRLNFHDCVGFCDGCVNLKNPDNAGLGNYITPLQKLYTEKKYADVISVADFWVLAGNEAVGMASEKVSGPRLKVPFRWGRRDCPTAPTTNVNNTYPDAHGDTDKVVGYFRQEFGFSPVETTALMGAHTLGRAASQNSGFDGPWVAGEDVLDNEYYRDLIQKKWEQTNIRDSRPQDPARWQWERNSGRFMMLNADIAFLKNMTIDDEGRCVNCATTDACPDLTGPVYDHTQLYAQNNAAWLRDFTSVYLKMVEHTAPEVRVLLREPVVEPTPVTSKPCAPSSASAHGVTWFSLVVAAFLTMTMH